MGQSASKAVSKVAAYAKPHTPSSPPGGIVGGGFKPPPAASTSVATTTKQDEGQRQFLKENSPGSDHKDMPVDLIKFIADAGPVKKVELPSKNATTAAAAATTPTNSSSIRISSTEKRATRPPRITLGALVDPTTDSSPAAAQDKTRVTKSMPLSKDMEGFNTNRTSSFSHTKEDLDANDFGLDVVEFYKLLTGLSTVDSVMATNTAGDIASRQEHLRLLKLSMQYVHVPVLLCDSDESYVGSFPNKADELMQIHRGMTELPTSRAKLVLEDLMDSEAEAKAELEKVSKIRIEKTSRT